MSEQRRVRRWDRISFFITVPLMALIWAIVALAGHDSTLVVVVFGLMGALMAVGVNWLARFVRRRYLATGTWSRPT